MPEMRFHIRWPDGTVEACYSPSLVVKDFLVPEQTYPVAEFLELSRTALTLASDRVFAKHGFPCPRAIGQLKRIESTAARFAASPEAQVEVLGFEE